LIYRNIDGEAVETRVAVKGLSVAEETKSWASAAARTGTMDGLVSSRKWENLVAHYAGD